MSVLIGNLLIICVVIGAVCGSYGNSVKAANSLSEGVCIWIFPSSSESFVGASKYGYRAIGISTASAIKCG